MRVLRNSPPTEQPKDRTVCDPAHRDSSRRALLGIAVFLVFQSGFASTVTAQGTLNVEKIEYKGWKNALKLSNSDVELIATLDVGPRILSYRVKDGQNVFKEYPDQLGKSGESTWQIRGGHRLWVAPEDLSRTYATDNTPISYEIEASGAVRLVQPADSHGIKKTMIVKLAQKGPEVTINHVIENAGKQGVTIAPWALTVMVPGGVEIIPQPPHAGHPGASANADNADAFLPSFTLVLWPYFEFSDPRWSFGKELILMRHMSRGPTKIGLSNTYGWAGYVNNGTLFVKRFRWDKTQQYPDRGVNYETFTNEEMVEMESLGPIVTLGPGEAVEHQETWSLHSGVGEIKTETDAAALVKKLVP